MLKPVKYNLAVIYTTSPLVSRDLIMQPHHQFYNPLSLQLYFLFLISGAPRSHRIAVAESVFAASKVSILLQDCLGQAVSNKVVQKSESHWSLASKLLTDKSQAQSRWPGNTVPRTSYIKVQAAKVNFRHYQLRIPRGRPWFKSHLKIEPA